jgi:predicted RNA-binding Zn ribbon-like protein
MTGEPESLDHSRSGYAGRMVDTAASGAAIAEAPSEGLRRVQAFVNTIDLESGRDAIASPALLAGWCADIGLRLDGEPPTAADLARAVAVREGLRALLLANAGEPLEPATLAPLRAIARDLPLVVTFDAAGASSLARRTDGIDGALAVLLAAVHEAMIAGNWTRLKACRNDGCRWAFFDRSKNRSRNWCSMAVCGSRVKSRTYRQRRRGTDPSA